MKQKNPLSMKELTNLFALFVGGTLSLIINYFVLPSFSFKFQSGVTFALFIFTLLSYEFVVISLVKYYIARGKESYDKHKKQYFWAVVSILAMTYAVSDAVKEASFLVFLRDTALILLTVFIAPKIANKFKENEPNSKK